MKSSPSTVPPLRVGLISLGCAKNLVDAEIMLGALLRDGMEITNAPADADVVIVNTCSFIDAAQEESVNAVLESAQLRDTRRRGQAIVVSGCLPQRFRDELPKLLPEVDAFMGIDQVAQAGAIVKAAIERRAGKLNLEFKVRGSKLKINQQLAALDRARPAGNHEEPKARRGTDKVGKTTAASPGPKSETRNPRMGDEERGRVVSASDPVLDVALRPTYIPDFATPRFRLTPKHFAYVKIAEGCNHPCSFCIIPRMRGSHRSRPQPDIVREARQLIAEGVKELNLISQDSTYYGLDLRSNHSRAIASPDKFSAAALALPADAATLCTLLRELNDLSGDFWIRLLYTHPAHWTDELIATIRDCRKVARYVDMPLQHIHDNMLERMRRETSRQHIIDLIAKIRAGVPGIALRTTFIVGFPGETDAYFDALLEFIRETRFERLGVFTYSREQGTRAGQMAGQLPDRIKRRRRDLAMAEQLRIAREHSSAQVDRALRVLVEHRATAKELEQARVRSWEHGLIRSADERRGPITNRFLVARSESDAPDIDGRVYVRGKAKPGEFARVKIVGHTDYDLIAEPA